eukprot:m.1118472 g.1118472  ORF g.1118472 m.1118472 type:complete len:219 (-) comp24385_c0_seq17:1859-2515(-)
MYTIQWTSSIYGGSGTSERVKCCPTATRTLRARSKSVVGGLPRVTASSVLVSSSSTSAAANTHLIVSTKGRLILSHVRRVGPEPRQHVPSIEFKQLHPDSQRTALCRAQHDMAVSTPITNGRGGHCDTPSQSAPINVRTQRRKSSSTNTSGCALGGVGGVATCTDVGVAPAPPARALLRAAAISNKDGVGGWQSHACPMHMWAGAAANAGVGAAVSVW